MARKCADKRTLAECLYCMARSLDQYRCVKEAEPYLREAIAIRQELQDNPTRLADYMNMLVTCLGPELSGSEAEPLLRQALDLHRRLRGDDDPSVEGDLYALAQCFKNRNKSEDAKAAATEAVELGRKVFRKDHRSLSLAVELLTDILITRGEWSEAEAVLRRAVTESPKNVVFWLDLGRFEARRQHWAAAVDDFSRALELDPNDPFELTVALLRTGRVEDYRQHCHRFLKEAANARTLQVTEHAAKASLLLPVEGADFELACQLADFTATANETRWVMSWYALLKALADYRRDRFDSALAWASRATNPLDPQCSSAAFFIEALAYSRSHNDESARTALAAGEKMVKECHPDPSDYGESPCDWAVADFLHSEAQKQINGGRANGIPSK